jgi:hypothetical protein
MRTLMCTVVAALALAPAARATVLPTNWIETQPYSGVSGSLRVSVRKIEVTKTTWNAWVGLSNRSSFRVKVTQVMTRGAGEGLPLVFFAGPGIWWQTYEKGSWWPGAGRSVTHSAKATSVTPSYPSTLAPRATWFGTFSGALTKVPKDRLLRIGFGSFEPAGGRVSLVSTTHQFRLPRR